MHSRNESHELLYLSPKDVVVTQKIVPTTKSKSSILLRHQNKDMYSNKDKLE